MQFRIDDDNLTVQFEGMEQLWAIKRKLVIPKINIVQAEWQEGTLIPRRELGWRIGGAAIPGVVYAGRFKGNKGLNFVYLQRPQWESDGVKLLHVLTLELKRSGYKRMLFTVNKPDIAEHIITWWSGNV